MLNGIEAAPSAALNLLLHITQLSAFVLRPNRDGTQGVSRCNGRRHRRATRCSQQPGPPPIPLDRSERLLAARTHSPPVPSLGRAAMRSLEPVARVSTVVSRIHLGLGHGPDRGCCARWTGFLSFRVISPADTVSPARRRTFSTVPYNSLISRLKSCSAFFASANNINVLS